MRRAIVLAASLLFALPALAGTISFNAASSTPAFNRTLTRTYTDANMQRFVAWAQRTYPKNSDGTNATAAQSFDMAINALFDGIVANILSAEKQTAQSAVSDPSPMN